MLSLPLIAPRPDPSLWPSHRVGAFNFEGASNDPQNPSAGAGHRHPNSQNLHLGARSTLSTLVADENNIFQRKQNVRKFGAGWIRPPGVAKTYQARMDEDAEREEQEILAQREQALLNLAAAQTDAANQETAAQGDEEMAEGERDLDDDVPEAEADESDVSSDIEDSEVAEGDTSVLDGQSAEVTFNEDSFIEGSMLQADVQHRLEMEEAEISGLLQDERDLDDDVPEAGSYEHTDTEVDLTSDDNEVSMLSAPSARRPHTGRRSSGVRSGRVQRHNTMAPNPRGSFGMEGSSSILDSSSFLRSSPAVARASLRSRLLGSRSRGPG